MSELLRKKTLICVVFALAAAGIAAAEPAGPSAAKPPAEPAKIDLSVSPAAVEPGARTEVTLRLRPKAGILVNRYPKIRLSVEEAAGLVGAAEAAVGNDAPPPIGKAETNYFNVVEPVRLSIEVDSAASPGDHEIDGKLVYYYCVKKSGFCAPKRQTIKIPLRVR